MTLCELRKLLLDQSTYTTTEVDQRITEAYREGMLSAAEIAREYGYTHRTRHPFETGQEIAAAIIEAAEKGDRE